MAVDDSGIATALWHLDAIALHDPTMTEPAIIEKADVLYTIIAADVEEMQLSDCIVLSALKDDNATSLRRLFAWIFHLHARSSPR